MEKSKDVQIKGHKLCNDDCYYPQETDKDFFFPKGAPVFRDRVYRIGTLRKDIKATAVVYIEDIILKENIKIAPGDEIKGMASFDNRGVHRTLKGKVLPLLIFPNDTELV